MSEHFASIGLCGQALAVVQERNTVFRALKHLKNRETAKRRFAGFVSINDKERRLWFDTRVRAKRKRLCL